LLFFSFLVKHALSLYEINHPFCVSSYGPTLEHCYSVFDFSSLLLFFLTTFLFLRFKEIGKRCFEGFNTVQTRTMSSPYFLGII